MKLRALSGPNLRREIAYAVVLVSLGGVVLAALSYNTSPRESFAFEAIWPSPAGFVPGASTPNIQLHINYSSPAQGAYTYRFSYVAAGGATFVFEDRVLVSHYATFTAEHFVPVSGTPVTVLAEVYRGAPSDGALVFSEALTV